MVKATTIQKNYNSIDLFKFIMSICVVAIHTAPLINCSNTFILKIYGNLVLCAVPFFFLCTGFLLANKLNGDYSSNENLVIIKKYLFKTIKLYLIWMMIYFPLAIFGYVKTNTSFLKSILFYIRGFFFRGEHYNSWMLWYLLSTIYSLIFVLIFLKLKFSIKSICIIGFFLVMLGFGINMIANYQGANCLFLDIIKKFIKYTIGNGRIFQGAFYIPVGMIIFNGKRNFNFGVILFLLGFITNYFANGLLHNVCVIISSIGLFCLVVSLKLKDRFIYAYLRKTSTIIYFTHLYVWTFYYLLVYGNPQNGLDSFCVTTLVCIMISVMIIFMDKAKKYKKNKYSYANN